MTATHKRRIAKFIAALRSRRYKRHTGSLRSLDGKSHCCLGVACEVFRLSTKTGRWTKYGHFEIEGNRSGICLPSRVQDYYGFTSSDPVIDTGRQSGVVLAADANDTFNLPFGRIATAFERTYLKPKAKAKGR